MAANASAACGPGHRDLDAAALRRRPASSSPDMLLPFTDLAVFRDRDIGIELRGDLHQLGGRTGVQAEPVLDLQTLGQRRRRSSGFCRGGLWLLVPGPGRFRKTGNQRPRTGNHLSAAPPGAAPQYLSSSSRIVRYSSSRDLRRSADGHETRGLSAAATPAPSALRCSPTESSGATSRKNSLLGCPSSDWKSTPAGWRPKAPRTAREAGQLAVRDGDAVADGGAAEASRVPRAPRPGGRRRSRGCAAARCPASSRRRLPWFPRARE